MPIDKTYAKKVYDSLREDVEGFDKDEATFYNLIETDKDYLKKVHLTLKDVYGNEFDKDEAMFESALGLKKKAPTVPTIGYETASEGLGNTSLAKPEKLSQSPLKSSVTSPLPKVVKPKINAPVSNIDYLTQINDLYKTKVSNSTERLNTKKQLVELEPQLQNAQKQIDDLTVIYNDPNISAQERNNAANQINQITQQVQPIYSQYESLVNKYNESTNNDKDIITQLAKIEDLRQKGLEKEYNVWQNALEATGKGFVDAAAGIAGIFNTLGLSGDTEGGNDYNQEEVKQQTRQNIDKMRAFGQSLITQETPQEYQSLFKGKFTPKKLAYVAGEAVAQTIPTVVAGLVTGGAGTALVGGGMGFNESKDIMKTAGLDDNQAEWAALGLSIPLGALEQYGADDVVKALNTPFVKKMVADDIIKTVGKNATKEQIVAQAKKSLGKVITDKAGSILLTGLKEGSTEVAQGGLQEAVKQAVQEYTGVDTDEDMSTADYLKQQLEQRGEEFVSGALGGSVLQAAGETISGLAKYTPLAVSRAIDYLDIDKYDDFKEELSLEVEQGSITPEQADEAIQTVEKIQQVNAKIPENITDRDLRTKAINLVDEKSEIQSQIEGKDAALIDTQKERIKQIDAELKLLPQEQIKINEKETTTEIQPTETEVGVLNEQTNQEVAPEVVSETVSEIEPPVVEQTTTDVGGVTTPDVSEALKDVEIEKAIADKIIPKSVVKQKVYHGGESKIIGDFKNLNPNITGFWFSSDIDNAKTYGNEVTEAYVDIKNPLVIDATGLKFTDDIPVEAILKYPNEEPYTSIINLPIDDVVYAVKNGKRPNQFFEIKDREKYDGVIFKGIIDPALTSRREVPQDTIVVFDNTQIKKADGSNPELVKAVEELLGAKESKAITEPTKQERVTQRKAIAEAKVDELATKAKNFADKYLKAKGIEGAQKAGFGDQNKVIDVLANTVKTLINAGIEIDEAIKEVRAFFEGEYDTSDIKDYEIKQTIARDELSDYAKEKGFTSYRNAVFAVKKYVREVGAEDVITKEDIDKAKEAKEKESGTEPKAQPIGKKLRRNYKTALNYIQNIPDDVMEYMKQNPLSYNGISRKENLAFAKNYIIEQGESKGVPNAYDKFMNNEIERDITPAQFVSIGYLLRGAFAEEYNDVSKRLLDAETEAEQNKLKAEQSSLWDKQISLAKRIAEYGTKLGQGVDAYSLYAQVLTDEISAMFHFGKLVEKMAEETERKNTPKAKKIRTKVSETVKSGVKKTAQEMAKSANKYNTKPSSKSVAKKERDEAWGSVKSAFAKYKNLGASYNPWEEAKKDVDAVKALTKYFKAELKYKSIQLQQAIKEIAELLNIDESLVDKETVQGIIEKAKKDNDAEKVLAMAEKEAAKRAINAAKEVAKSAAQLETELAKERARIADLKAKEVIAQKEAIEAERLKRLQAEISERESMAKKLEQSIDKLAKEIANKPEVLETTFEQIIEDFYSGNFDTKGLVDLIKDRLEVNDAQANMLASKLENLLKTNIRDKIAKQLDKQIDKATPKDRKPPQKNDIYQTLIRAQMMNVLNESTIQDILGPIFNIPKMTADDIAFVKETMSKYKLTGDPSRKAELLGKMVKRFSDKNPVSMSDVYDSFWYANVLSGLTTTGINLTFGFDILNYAYLSNFVLNAGKVTKAILGNGDVKEQLTRSAYNYWRSVFQTGTKKPKDILKGMKMVDTPLYETVNNVMSVMKYGPDVFLQENKNLDYNKKAEFELSQLTNSKNKALLATLYTGDVFRKGVPAVLNGIDLGFSTTAKNLYLVPVLEDYYKEQGLKGKELTEAIENAIFNTQEELENAQKKAKADRKLIDITIEEKNGKWVVTDNAAMFGKTKTFNTKEEAEAHIDKISSDGTKFNKGVIDYLNAKLPKQSVDASRRIASRYLLTAEPEGVLGQIYDKHITTWRIGAQQAFKNEMNTKSWRALNYAFDKMIVFLRVPFNMFNLAIDNSPLGFARYLRGNGIFNNYKRAEYTETERNLILAHAMIGTIMLAYELFAQDVIKLGDDDDDDELKRKQEILAAWNEKYPNETLNIDNPIFELPKDGELFGSLDFLPANKKKFLVSNNLAAEFSRYDAKSNRFVSYQSSPQFLNYALVSGISNYEKYIINDNTKFTDRASKKKEWWEVTKWAVSNMMTSYLNLSGMKSQQQIISIFNKKNDDGIDKMAELLTSSIQLNPALIKQLVANNDGVMRERLTPTKDTWKWAANKFVPIGGAFVKGDKMYDMLGHEMPMVYGSKQGGLLGYYFDAKFKEKELERTKIATWLDLNGYTKFRDFAKEFKNKEVAAYENGGYVNKTLLNDKELKEVGVEAAKLAEKLILDNKGMLNELTKFNIEDVDYKSPTLKTPFAKGIDVIFSAAFRYKWREAAYKKGYLSKEAWEEEKYLIENIPSILEQTDLSGQALEDAVAGDLVEFGYSKDNN